MNFWDHFFHNLMLIVIGAALASGIFYLASKQTDSLQNTFDLSQRKLDAMILESAICREQHIAESECIKRAIDARDAVKK